MRASATGKSAERASQRPQRDEKIRTHRSERVFRTLLGVQKYESRGADFDGVKHADSCECPELPSNDKLNGMSGRAGLSLSNGWLTAAPVMVRDSPGHVADLRPGDVSEIAFEKRVERREPSTGSDVAMEFQDPRPRLTLHGARTLQHLVSRDRELGVRLQSLADGHGLTNGELLALQAEMYSHTQRMELATRSIDRLIQALKQVATMQG